MSRRDRRYLSIAAELALLSNGKMQHGAVLVRGGRVMGRGRNIYKNHPTILETTRKIRSHASRHAEIAAMHGIPANVLRGCTIYIARVRKCGRVGYSAPCAECQQALDKAGVRKIIYTRDEVSA